MLSRTLFTLFCLVAANLAAKAQHVYSIRADSVRIYNVCDTAELIIENRTQDTIGYLYNKGAGRTEFKKVRLLKLPGNRIAIPGQDTIDLSDFKTSGKIDTIIYKYPFQYQRIVMGGDTVVMRMPDASSIFTYSGPITSGLNMTSEIMMYDPLAQYSGNWATDAAGARFFLDKPSGGRATLSNGPTGAGLYLTGGPAENDSLKIMFMWGRKQKIEYSAKAGLEITPPYMANPLNKFLGDGRLTGAFAKDANDFVIKSQLDSLRGKIDSVATNGTTLQQATTAGNVTSNAFWVTGDSGVTTGLNGIRFSFSDSAGTIRSMGVPRSKELILRGGGGGILGSVGEAMIKLGSDEELGGLALITGASEGAMKPRLVVDRLGRIKTGIFINSTQYSEDVQLGDWVRINGPLYAMNRITSSEEILVESIAGSNGLSNKGIRFGASTGLYNAAIRPWRDTVANRRGLSFIATNGSTLIEVMKIDDLGNLNVKGTITAPTITQTSRRELKTDIQPFGSSALDVVRKAQVRTFRFKADTSRLHIGFIADEVPEEMAVPDRSGVNHGNTMALLVKAVQELEEKNRLLENANNTLQQQNKAMEQRLQAIEDMIKKQNTQPGKAK